MPLDLLQCPAVNLADPLDRLDPLSVGLMARWKVLPELSGGPMLPDLGGRFAGTLSGTPLPAWQPTTRPGGAGQLSFSGSSPYVAVTCPVTGPPLTLTCWFNATSITSYLGLIMSRDDGLVGLALSDHSGNPLTCDWNASEYSDATGLTITTGKWYFAAAVITSAGVTTYLGDPSTGTISSFTHTETCPSRTITNWSIGRDPNGFHWNGLIDDVGLYRRAFSPAEITAFYQATRSADPVAQGLSRVDMLGWTLGAGGASGNASGAAPALSLSAPSGTATGAAVASGTAPALSLTAPAGAAGVIGLGNASGAAPGLSFSAPAGRAVDFAGGVTDEGINHILNTEFASGAQVSQWWVTVIDGGGTPVLRPTDTLALHPGWFERDIEMGQGLTGPRRAWKVKVATAGEVGNDRVMLFTNLIAPNQPVYGFFLTSAPQGQFGVLFATLALAGGVKLMDLHESLVVSLTVFLTRP